MRNSTATNLRQALRWLPIGVIAVQIALLISGVLTVSQAAIVFLTFEIVLTIVIAGQFLVVIRRYGGFRRRGVPRTEAMAEALKVALPKPVAVLIRHELSIFGAIATAAGRRRSTAPGERILTYGGHIRSMLIFMVGISVLEIGVVELLVPLAWLRWTFLILGAYGLFWVIGFACSIYTRPHTVSEEHIRLRFATFAAISVPLTPAAVFSESLGSHNKLVEIDGDTAALSVLGLTNASVRLAAPVSVNFGRTGVHKVKQVRFYVDDPATALAAARAVVAKQDSDVTNDRS